MTRKFAPWAAFLAVGTVMAGLVILSPRSAVQDLGYSLVALAGIAAMMVGARLHRPNNPAGWYLVAVGMAVWVVGGAIASVQTWSDAPTPVEPDLVRLATYPLVAVGLMTFARGGSAGRRLTAMLDTAILTTAAGMVSVVFLVSPAWATGEGLDRFLDVAFPVGNVLLFGALVGVSYAPGVARVASGMLAGAIGLMLIYQGVGQVITGLPRIDTRPQELATPWVLAFVLAGAAALHPSMRRLTDLPEPSADPPHGRQVLGLGLALASGPLVIGLQYAAGEPTSAGIVAIFYVPLIVLVTVRMLALIRQINDQAISDDLTGLPNRRALHRASRARFSDTSQPQALLLLDLDRFKEVNDSLGHPSGDELLVQVAGRLRSGLRAADTLVRLGGDEFAILLDGASGPEAEGVAASLGAVLEEPFDLGELAVHSSASIGISLFPEHGTDLSTLMRKADIAMYRAKATGGYRTHGEGGADGGGGLRLSEEFRAALSENQLVLHFQPKIDLATSMPRGVEALVRWEHPRRGLLLPGEFLERVEEAGLMRAMTRRVLGLAMDQAVVWKAAGHERAIAVNLSASGLVEVDLAEKILAMLTERNLAPSALQLEITEDALMGDRDRARTILAALRDAGVFIAVDDFGTGYSSLSYLRDLPIDELKLDRSFIAPMTANPRAAALVASTIGLAHSLDLRMVAEGVEDGATYAALARLGCDQAQGHFMARPMPADELERWFTRSVLGHSGRVDAPCVPAGAQGFTRGQIRPMG